VTTEEDEAAEVDVVEAKVVAAGEDKGALLDDATMEPTTEPPPSAHPPRVCGGGALKPDTPSGNCAPSKLAVRGSKWWCGLKRLMVPGGGVGATGGLMHSGSASGSTESKLAMLPRCSPPMQCLQYSSNDVAKSL
jgi:hypothetical protein